jgi:hypothetical protein
VQSCISEKSFLILDGIAHLTAMDETSVPDVPSLVDAFAPRPLEIVYRSKTGAFRRINDDQRYLRFIESRHQKKVINSYRQ